METTDIRQKLHEFIDTMEDKKAEAIYTLFESQIEDEYVEYTDEFKAELDEMNDYYEKGGDMISADEVKKQINAVRRKKKAS